MNHKFLSFTIFLFNFTQGVEQTPEYAEFIQRFPNATEDQKSRCRAAALRIASIDREIIQANQDLQEAREQNKALFRQILSSLCPCLRYGIN